MLLYFSLDVTSFYMRFLPEHVLLCHHELTFCFQPVILWSILEVLRKQRKSFLPSFCEDSNELNRCLKYVLILVTVEFLKTSHKMAPRTHETRLARMTCLI